MSLSAYDLARIDGFTGSEIEFFKAKYLSDGFDVVKTLGYEGTEHDIQALFIEKQAPLNAYELAISYGYKGTAKDWLESLNGLDGADAFEVALKSGFEGSRDEWLNSIKGLDGLDAYQLALTLGFEGTLAEFIESLKGADASPSQIAASVAQYLQANPPPKGDKGDKGDDGLDGEKGDMPDHQWRGTSIRFEKPDGSWGQWVELRGLRGPNGEIITQPVINAGGGGGSLSIQKFYNSFDDFPETGKTQILYFDKSTTPYSVYIWDGVAYQAIGGGEGSVTPSELISADAENRIMLGSDSKLFVSPETAYTVAIKVKNQTGSTILKGTPLMAVGTLGMSGQILAAPMDGTNPANAKFLIGLAATNIVNGGDGEVVDIGKIRLLNTSAYAEGDVLWISTDTVGALTNVEPSNGFKMPVAFVVTSAVNTGVLMVRITPINEAAFVEHSFETIAKNLKAKDATLSYTSGDLETVEYSNGIIKTLAYNSGGDLETITLSGSTPLGINLVKTLGYTDGNLSTITFSLD
jgi:hypothetical protein